MYRELGRAIREGLVASVHGVYRGGLGVHLALVAMGGDLGMTVDLAQVPAEGVDADAALLFSESAGRFIVTVAPEHRAGIEGVFEGLPFACIGETTAEPDFQVRGIRGQTVCRAPVRRLREAWKKPFQDLV